MLRLADVLAVIRYKTLPSLDMVGLELCLVLRHVCVKQRCNLLVGDCRLPFRSEGLWFKVHTTQRLHGSK
ncbi:hypothetical protein GGP41_003860 [Bipolaris sorokiniana]|uniref:Uncharacterized protein n=1 Tax=Cochliobolus sativus TaxID=45130 RepID=A0A8H5ZEM8_COCSA|nr:hypothetical protein GGP41_003860 [Bipolaris sorokiniana]